MKADKYWMSAETSWAMATPEIFIWRATDQEVWGTEVPQWGPGVKLKQFAIIYKLRLQKLSQFTQFTLGLFSSTYYNVNLISYTTITSSWVKIVRLQYTGAILKLLTQLYNVLFTASCYARSSTDSSIQQMHRSLPSDLIKHWEIISKKANQAAEWMNITTQHIVIMHFTFLF